MTHSERRPRGRFVDRQPHARVTDGGPIGGVGRLGLDRDCVDRRSVLAGGTAFAVAELFALPFLGTGPARAAFESLGAFTPGIVIELAEKLSRSDYVKPQSELPTPFDELSYDQYRDIRFRAEKTVWKGAGRNAELQFFPLGWLFNAAVDIHLVEDGQQHRLKGDVELFDFGPLVGEVPPGTEIGFSGFRMHAPINRPDYFDEVVVFQGASYFRALGRGHAYGLSARGLAIDTAQPTGEEFPSFRAFWIERPAVGAKSLVIHALLDSPSVAGAYRFVVTPGLPTAIETEVTLFPRREMSHVGIAPLTSMFLFSALDRQGVDDFRPAVHDSDALAILNGQGECIWRPLANPKKLQISAFADVDPRGFGLIQRSRKLEAFEDLEARYDKRPSVWVEPQGNFGKGSVDLIEIPSREEIHDNIVAFWRPAEPMAAGKRYDLSYRLSWSDDIPVAWPMLRVTGMRSGEVLKFGNADAAGGRQFVIDYGAVENIAADTLPSVGLTTTAGSVSEPIAQINPETNGLRVSFKLMPGEAEMAELRLLLQRGEEKISETWLYRWTKD